jgi:hypothetical protein
MQGLTRFESVCYYDHCGNSSIRMPRLSGAHTHKHIKCRLLKTAVCSLTARSSHGMSSSISAQPRRTHKPQQRYSKQPK